MIKIFYDIVDNIPVYYVAEEVEYEKGFKKFRRLSGQYKSEKEAEKALKSIKKRGDIKTDD